MISSLRYAVAAASGLLLLPALAHSQQRVAQPPNNEIDNILVTASRTPVPWNQTASSITVIDSQELANRQSAQLTDILRSVPGLAVSRQGVVGSSTQIRVRGTEGNHVLVFIDGVEANDLSQGGEFNFAHLGTQDIERVEIIRGPQSALWGSDAVGGVINIISKKGTGSNFQGYAEGGSFNTLHSGASLAQSGERYHVKLSAELLESDGENISRQGSEKDGYKNQTFGLLAGYQPVQHFSLQASLRHIEAENDYDGTDFNTGLPADSDHVTESAQTYAGLQAQLSLWENRWQHQLSISSTHTDNDNFFAGVEETSTQGKKTRYGYQSSLAFDTPAFADAAHRLTLAIEHEDEDFSQRGTASPFGDPNKDISIDSTAYVAEYRLSLWQALHLSASLRQDENEAFEDASTHRFGVAYNLANSGTKLRAAYGTGSKNPTFTERFGYFDNFIGNPALQPEESQSWEVGIDQSLWQDRALLSLTYFQDRLKHEINGFVFDPNLFAFTAANLEGISHRQGLEFSLSAQLTEQLSADATYTYIDATEPDGNGRQRYEVRRPRNSASLALNYSFTRANLNLSAQYSGEQRDDFFPPFPLPQQRIKLDGYTLVTLAGSYQLTETLSLFGRVENLLDEDYEEIIGYRTPGLAAYAGLRFNFGR